MRGRIIGGLTASILLSITGLAASARSIEPAPALGGPVVTERAGKPSLVKRDMEGRLERLEGRPEIAALELLNLTAGERAEADKMLAERAGRIAIVRSENQTTIVKLQGARQAGDSQAARAALQELRPKLADLLEPTLEARLAGAIPAARRDEFSQLLREYFAAAAAGERAGQRGGQRPEGRPRGERPGVPPAGEEDGMRPQGEEPAAPAEGQGPSERPRREGKRPGGREGPGGEAGGPAARSRIEFAMVLRELSQDLGAAVQERRDRSDELLSAVGATPEQAERIRAAMRNAADGSGAPPTAQQRQVLMQAIMKELTPEQQAKAREFFRGRRGPG